MAGRGTSLRVKRLASIPSDCYGYIASVLILSLQVIRAYNSERAAVERESQWVVGPDLFTWKTVVGGHPAEASQLLHLGLPVAGLVPFVLAYRLFLFPSRKFISFYSVSHFSYADSEPPS